MSEKAWFRPLEAAEYTGLSRAYIYELISDGKIDVYKVGRTSTLARADLDALMAAGRRPSVANTPAVGIPAPRKMPKQEKRRTA